MIKKPTAIKKPKFGTYLPTNTSKELMPLLKVVEALERFFGEYLNGISTLKTRINVAASDSLFIAGEYTAYLFRSVLEAIYDGGIIDTTILNNDKEFSICFAHRRKYRLDDEKKLDALLDAAKLSGFEVSIIGNGIILRAPILHGRLYISARSREGLYTQLERVFFAPSFAEYLAEWERAEAIEKAAKGSEAATSGEAADKSEASVEGEGEASDAAEKNEKS